MSVLWIYLVIMFVCLVLVQGAEKRCPTLKLEGGRVRYKNKRIIATFTCNNGYTRYGSELAVCIQGHWSVPTPQCVGTLCTKPSVDPPVIIESFMNGGLLQFFCKPGFVRVGPERIYCKLSDWNLKPPTCTVGVSESCDFEDGVCGWSDDLTDSFDWTRNKGDTPTADTGPMVDHTRNNSNGHYIFIESSAPQSNGSKARFLSPFYSPESLDNKCLEFYYHMLGDHNVGVLEVLLRPMKIPTEALNSDHQIFYKKGNQGDKWIKASVMIPEVTEPTQIVFQGTVSGWLGDIALDDISVTSCDTATAATQTVPSARLTSQTTQYANTAQPVTTMQSGPKTTMQVTTSTDTPKVTKLSTSVTLTTTMVSKITSKAPTAAVKTATSAKTTTLSKVSTTAVKASTADVKTTAAATVKTTAATVKITTAATVKTTTSVKSTAASQPVQTTLKSSLPIRVSTTATLSTTRKPTTETTSRTTAATEVYRAETTPTITYQTSVSSESTAPRLTKVDQTSATWSSTDMAAASKITSTPDEGASSYQTSQKAVVSDITTNKDFVSEATKTTLEAETTNEDSNDYNTGDGGSDNKNTSDGEEPGDDNDDNDDTEPEETTSPISDSKDNETSEDSSVYSNGDMDSDMLTPQDNDGSNAASGKVHGSDETSGTKELLPLIIGVVSAVVVGAVVIGILTWRWSKNQRMKQQKEEDDQMNIITEYVETNLNV